MSGRSDPTAALVLGVAAGVFTFFQGFKVFREYKIVEDTPRIPIRSVAMGLVRVRGRAQAAAPTRSPVTHTPCCFYKVEIEQWRVHNNTGRWEHLRTDCDGGRFYLQDDTGQVLVDPFAAELDLPAGAAREVNSNRSSGLGSSGASDVELLQYVNQSAVTHVTTAMERWMEKRGPLDDPKREEARQSLLRLIQVAQHTARGAGVPGDLVEKVLEARGPLPDAEKEEKRQHLLEQVRQMQTAPLPEAHLGAADGRYRFSEYLVSPGLEYNITGSCVENPRCDGGADRTMISRGEHESTFLISWKSDAETQQTLLKRARWMVLGGAVLALGCLALLLGHLGLY